MKPLRVKDDRRMTRAWLALAAAGLAVAACGRAGEADSVACALCGPRNDIRGSISSQNGSQAQMAGWVVTAFEKDTGIARVSEVDGAGLFTLQQSRTEKAQTLALLSPDYIVQSVLSIPNEKAPATIKQFFQYKSPNLPKLIHKGQIVSFQDFQGITVTKDLASDQDSNGVPDGSTSIDGDPTKLWEGWQLLAQAAAGEASFSLQAGAVDLDLDGTPNQKDPDIDGDGIINWLDPDDNGNGIRDPFDGDQNGDLENDAAPGQEDIDLYFKEGVEYVAVQFEMKPKADASGDETTLKFTTKIRKDVTPLSVQIRGAPSLLNGANFIAPDAAGVPTVVAWNRLLGDDGLSEDNSANDRIYSKKVVLEGSKTPRFHEVVFFQLVFGTPDKPWYMEFPYTFPDLRPSGITAQYEPNARAVLLIGNPFGDQIQDFVWAINIWDESLTKVLWTSQAQSGTVRQATIPENVLVADTVYKYTVVAQTMDKVPGFPAYTVHSPTYDLE
jgi:hypothetical protein